MHLFLIVKRRESNFLITSKTTSGALPACVYRIFRVPVTIFKEFLWVYEFNFDFINQNYNHYNSFKNTRKIEFYPDDK